MEYDQKMNIAPSEKSEKSTRQENLRRATVGGETAFKDRKSAVSFYHENISEISTEETDEKKLSSASSSNAARRRVSFGDLPTNPSFKSAQDIHKLSGHVLANPIRENDIAEDVTESSADEIKVMTDDGSAITVVKFDVDQIDTYDEHLAALLNSIDQTNIHCFIVNLGMLGQHTIYNVKFSLNDSKVLSETDWNDDDVEGKIEFTNYTESGAKFTKGIQLELNEILSDKEISGHHFDVKISTSDTSHINEPFILRNAKDHSVRSIIIFKATALGKSHGTPMLKVGIHKIGHTAEYMDSDFKTEWQGFVDVNAE